MKEISKPLLKWPGGKRALLKYILPLIPDKYGTYFEPFLGGGALFFSLQPANAILSDNNPVLINFYTQVCKESEELIKILRNLNNNERSYYEIRNRKPSTDLRKAVRFLYLITLSFNGIYRTNLRGEFNVPYGHKTHLKPCDPDRIREACRVLNKAKLLCSDYEFAVSTAKKGDLIYFDPPYTVAHGNNGFLKYNEKIFSWNDQVRLAQLSKDLANRGCNVIVSNAHNPSVLDLYKEFNRMEVERSSLIAASNKFRGQIQEYIFYRVG